uniref:Uncharacterized protein n=1 Tax=Meloidogyne enterolobii TaxID=390850 RepID=A0A6V7UIC1_MELEN|nr:unnamed protein product [Meloidogyne enterolobii]
MLGEQIHSAALVLYVLSVFPFVVENTETNENCIKIAKKECRNSHVSVLDFNITGPIKPCVIFKIVVVSCFDSLGIISECDLTILQSVLEESNILTVDLSNQHKNKESRSKEHWQDGGSRTWICRSLFRSRSVVETEKHGALMFCCCS